MLRGLAELRSWDSLTVCDLDPARAAALAASHARGRPAGQVSDARQAARGADTVIIATWSRAPLLAAADVRPGAHVTSLGADEPGQAELAADLLKSARVLVDDIPLAVASGALGTGGLTAVDAAGTLSQVLSGTIPGTTSPAEVTIYTPVGLPWQDLALAWAAYHQARSAGIGSEFDFLA